MDSMKALLVLISNNYMSVILLIVLGLGIYAKVKTFLSSSKEEQKRILEDKLAGEATTLMNLIQAGILDFVIDAEKKFGEKTGKLKNSAVYNMIIEKYPAIVDYIKQGYITRDFIDECIDEGVEMMNSLIESNKYLKALVKTETPNTEESKEEEPSPAINAESVFSSYDLSDDTDDYSFDGTEE